MSDHRVTPDRCPNCDADLSDYPAVLVREVRVFNAKVAYGTVQMKRKPHHYTTYSCANCETEFFGTGWRG